MGVATALPKAENSGGFNCFVFNGKDGGLTRERDKAGPNWPLPASGGGFQPQLLISLSLRTAPFPILRRHNHECLPGAFGPGATRRSLLARCLIVVQFAAG